MILVVFGNGYIQIIRKTRTMSDKSTAFHHRGNHVPIFIYHELTYNSRLMDTPLGIQYNKNTDNKFQSEDNNLILTPSLIKR